MILLCLHKLRHLENVTHKHCKKRQRNSPLQLHSQHLLIPMFCIYLQIKVSSRAEKSKLLLIAEAGNRTSNLMGLFCIMFISMPKLLHWGHIQATESAYKTAVVTIYPPVLSGFAMGQERLVTFWGSSHNSRASRDRADDKH